MGVNLEYYKVFYYVCVSGSITAAAERICISQPAVSQAIKLLEETLGSKLFLRGSKGVKLTPEGELLYSYIKRGYEMILKGEECFKKMVDLESGEVRIGASDMTLQYYLLPYLEKFHDEYPKIKVSVTNAPTPETLTYLRQGKIDFGVVTTPFECAVDLKTRYVRKIETVFVAGNDFISLKDKTLPLTILRELPLIFLEGETSTRSAVERFLADNEVYIEPEFELATSAMIVQFAVRNLGVGCVSDDFVKEYIDNGQLFQLKFDREQEKRNICIVNSEKNPISKAGKQLLEILKEENI